MEQSNITHYLEDQLTPDSIDGKSQAIVWKQVNKEIGRQAWKRNIAFAFFSLTAVVVVVAGIGVGVLQQNSTQEQEQIIADDIENEGDNTQDELSDIEDSSQDETNVVNSNQVVAEEIDLLLASITQDIGSLQIENDFEDIGL